MNTPVITISAPEKQFKEVDAAVRAELKNPEGVFPPGSKILRIKEQSMREKLMHGVIQLVFAILSPVFSDRRRGLRNRMAQIFLSCPHEGDPGALNIPIRQWVEQHFPDAKSGRHLPIYPLSWPKLDDLVEESPKKEHATK